MGLQRLLLLKWCMVSNDADDAPVSEQEKGRRHDIVPEEHRKRVGAEHPRSRPDKSHAFAVHHFHCRPCRDEITTAAVNPRQDDSRIRHPATVVVAVNDRANYLHVALDGDDNQTKNGTVRGNGYYCVGAEQETDDPDSRHLRWPVSGSSVSCSETDDPLTGHRRCLESVRDQSEHEKQTGKEIENRLMDDEHVDILSTTLAGAQQRQQNETIGNWADWPNGERAALIDLRGQAIVMKSCEETILSVFHANVFRCHWRHRITWVDRRRCRHIPRWLIHRCIGLFFNYKTSSKLCSVSVHNFNATALVQVRMHCVDQKESRRRRFLLRLGPITARAVFERFRHHGWTRCVRTPHAFDQTRGWSADGRRRCPSELIGRHSWSALTTRCDVPPSRGASLLWLSGDAKGRKKHLREFGASKNVLH